MRTFCQCCRRQTADTEVGVGLPAVRSAACQPAAEHGIRERKRYCLAVAAAVYDYQFTNSEGCIFNKLVFLNW